MDAIKLAVAQTLEKQGVISQLKVSQRFLRALLSRPSPLTMTGSLLPGVHRPSFVPKYF